MLLQQCMPSWMAGVRNILQRIEGIQGCKTTLLLQVPNPFILDLSFFTATASASASPDIRSKGPADPAAGTHLPADKQPCSSRMLAWSHIE